VALRLDTWKWSWKVLLEEIVSSRSLSSDKGRIRSA
jgi:hypothetical protein